MLIRRERPSDVPAIRAVTADAFSAVEHAAPSVAAGVAPGDRIALVAETGRPDPQVVGHVVATRGRLADRPALGLGPLSVRRDHQQRGVASALMHTILGAADALGEPVVVLLGEPALYSRFGFVPASALGIEAPEPAWGDYFQARTLSAWRDEYAGRFTYAAPFDRL